MKKNVANIIKETLEQDILTGNYVNGTQLNELKLAERFQVSRTPIRECFRLLASSGLIELKLGKGAFVRLPSFAELIEMFEVMAEVEGICARLAAKRISPQLLVGIINAHNDCKVALTKGDSDLYYRENEIFHHLIYEASGNSYLAKEASELHKRLQPFRRLQLRVKGRLEQSLVEHTAIVDALKKGDETTILNIARNHVLVQGERFNDLMESYNKST